MPRWDRAEPASVCNRPLARRAWLGVGLSHTTGSLRSLSIAVRWVDREIDEVKCAASRVIGEDRPPPFTDSVVDRFRWATIELIIGRNVSSRDIKFDVLGTVKNERLRTVDYGSFAEGFGAVTAPRRGRLNSRGYDRDSRQEIR